MPPKKGAAKAKTPVKAAVGAVEAPATVMTAKDKEIPTTAAAARSRRATAVTETPSKKTPVKKTASKGATTAKTTTTTTNKKRGRPAKAAEDDLTEHEPPKKRGRPAKSQSETPAPAKKRGRPANGAAPAPAVPIEEKAPPKKRGRPPKGHETTHVEAEDEAAAEQLGDELDEAAENEAAEETRKRISSVKKGKGAKGRPKKATTKDINEVAENEDGAKEVTTKQYWLMKAEQEDREEMLKDGSVFNAKFTIDDLRDKNGPEPWDGVRNPTACKNMRAMRVGDLAFFYASGGKKGRVPGITGIMEIVKEHEPDPSALDENSPFYVDNPKMRGSVEKPRWSMVHVEFRKKLSEPVTLADLKKFAEKNSVLSEMQELNAARLSVSKVSEKEWDFIVNELIEGYEGEAAALPTATVNGIPANNAQFVDDTIVGETVVEQANGDVVQESIESDVPTTDTVLAVETAATSSRPASPAGSKKPGSRAGSRAGSRTGSRAGSLAPPATKRGRSRTPRGATPQQMTVFAEEMEVIRE